MSRRLNNYLRTFRKRSGLSQAEVAFLLGCSNPSKVSRYERSTRQPNLKTTLAFEAVYQGTSRELFAGLFEDIKKSIQKRAAQIIRKLETKAQNNATARKLLFLRSITGEPSGSIQK